MAFPLVPVLGGVALALGAKYVYDHRSTLMGDGAGGSTNKLESGKVYGIQVTCQFTPEQTKQITDLPSLIKLAIESLGFTLLQPPAPRDPAAFAANAPAGKEFDMVALAKWNGASGTPDFKKPGLEWIKSWRAYPMPSA